MAARASVHGELVQRLPMNYDNVEEQKDHVCKSLLRHMEHVFATIARGELDKVAFQDAYHTATDLIIYKRWVPLRAIALEALRKLSLVASPDHYLETLKRICDVLSYHESDFSTYYNKLSTPSLTKSGRDLFYRFVAARWRRLRLAVYIVCATNRRLKWWLAFAACSCHPTSAYIATHVAPEFYALA